MAAKKKPPGTPPDRIYTRPEPGESINEMAKRMADALIAALNRHRAENGLPPLPKRPPKK